MPITHGYLNGTHFPPIRKKLAIVTLIASTLTMGLWGAYRYTTMTKTEASVVLLTPLTVSYHLPSKNITINGLVYNSVYRNLNVGDKVKIGYPKNGVLRPYVIDATTFWVSIKQVVIFPFVVLFIYGILNIIIPKN